MRNLLSALSAFALLFIGCSKEDPADGTGTGTGTGSNTPFFEYKIGSASVVHVDCSHISFAATGTGVAGILATSASNNSTLSFAFYGAAAKMDTVALGDKLLIAYSNFQQFDPLHISLKAPATPGGTDYYYALTPSSPAEKHTVTSISKAGIEGGKQVYWIEGTYYLKAQQLPGSNTAFISGKYRFKLLTVL